MTASNAPTIDPFLQSLMGDFLDESRGLLQNLNDQLMRLDDLVKAAGGDVINPEPTLLKEMFRAAHSLKGLSGMLGLNNINQLTHKIENVFDAARSGELSVNVKVVDVIYRAVGKLEAMIDLLNGVEGGQTDSETELAEIESLLKSNGAERPQGAQGDVDVALKMVSNETGKLNAPTMEISPPATQPPSPLANVKDDDDIPAKYLGIFIDESELTVEELSSALLAGPTSSDNEGLLVGCHRLKGSAASIGLNRIARLSHFMEDLLQEQCQLHQPLSPEVAESLLKCIDAIRIFITSLRTGRPNDVLDDACRQLLDVSQLQFNAASKGSKQDSAVEQVDSTDFLRDAATLAPKNSTGFIGQVAFEPRLALMELKAQVLLEKLHRLGTLFYCQPSEDRLEIITETALFTFGIETDVSESRMRQELQIEGTSSLTLRPLSTSEVESASVAILPSNSENDSKPQVGTADAPATAISKSKPTETLRVDIDRLDQLMNLAGQLVINKARFSQIGARLKTFSTCKTALNSILGARANALRLSAEIEEAAASPAGMHFETMTNISEQLKADLAELQQDLSQLSQMRTVLNDLAEAIHQLDRVSDGIQNTVMDTRMVPIGPLFHRFTRVVRDLARSNDKQISLELLGESTELDKRMIDELGDPLIHLIRNSADHGIETCAERIAAGKPPLGTIRLDAFHRGNRIVIRVIDDGRGLDAERIRKKGLAKGLINEAEAECMSLQQIYQLIWNPGFSTAERITEVSGRGMGMDIVRFKIEQLNGTVELSSEPGKGTTFEIKLPLTMAILPSLMIVVDGDVFAIPVESVVEIVRLKPVELPTVHGRRTARLRGRVISLVELSDALHWNGSKVRRPAEQTEETTVVIVGSEENEFGLVVDSLIGEQDVVIKSLEENFRNVEGIAGASILGDGRVSLILDVSALLEMVKQPLPMESLPRDTSLNTKTLSA